MSKIRKFMKHKLAAISTVFLASMIFLALLAPIIAPYDPNQIVGGFSEPPSFSFILGTDQVGRDVFSRLLYGTRISLFVGFAAAFLSTSVGIIIGLVSGFFGGWIDMILMRMTDVVMSFPYILLVLVAAAVFEPGLLNMILILGFVDWPGAARLVRANVLSIRETNYVQASKVAGMPAPYLLFSEILPNALPPVLVYSTSIVAISMLDEAALSFLGMGIQPPDASLGNMLNGAQSLTILTSKPWLWIPPGVLLILLVMSTYFIGDALRDAFDPSTKKEKN